MFEAVAHLYDYLIALVFICSMEWEDIVFLYFLGDIPFSVANIKLYLTSFPVWSALTDLVQPAKC